MLDSRALGIYSIAYRLPEVLLASIAYTLGVVAFPALARRRARDPPCSATATLQLLRYMALYALPVAAGLAVLSGPIVDLLFSQTWHDAAPLLVPIAVAAALYTVVFPLGDLLKAVGRQSTIVKINVVLIPLMIGACVLERSRRRPRGQLGARRHLGGVRGADVHRGDARAARPARRVRAARSSPGWPARSACARRRRRGAARLAGGLLAGRRRWRPSPGWPARSSRSASPRRGRSPT